MKNAIISAIVAALVASGGTYAAGRLDGHQIANHSIPAWKLTRGAIKSLHGLQGPAGLQGQQGDQGPQGPQGATPPLSVHRVLSEVIPVLPGEDDFATANCPAGETAISGGGATSGGASLNTSALTTSNGWMVDITNQTTERVFLQAVVICAS